MGEARHDRRPRPRDLGLGLMALRRTRPPYRADHVGSLLRPAALKEARLKHERGEIDAAELRAAEDEAIAVVIRKQEAVGLKAVTDGEFRRASWQTDFLVALDGVESYYGERKMLFKGPQPRPILLRLKHKLGAFHGHPMLAHFRFVADHAKVAAKMTIPSPSTLHFRYGRDAVPTSIYPDMEDFYHDLGATYAQVVRAFADAGCRYLQLDEVNLAYLCDPALREQVRARGDDPDRLPDIYADMINAAIRDIPADILFNTIKVHGYFMEYDSARAGSFEPLRLVPPDKTVVLGLVTSKSGVLESKDTIKRRIDAASKFVSLEQLCVSPQCGFASTEEGNVLGEDEQWAKLAMIVEVAQEVWGS